MKNILKIVFFAFLLLSCEKEDLPGLNAGPVDIGIEIIEAEAQADNTICSISKITDGIKVEGTLKHRYSGELSIDLLDEKGELLTVIDYTVPYLDGDMGAGAIYTYDTKPFLVPGGGKVAAFNVSLVGTVRSYNHNCPECYPSKQFKETEFFFESENIKCGKNYEFKLFNTLY